MALGHGRLLKIENLSLDAFIQSFCLQTEMEGVCEMGHTFSCCGSDQDTSKRTAFSDVNQDFAQMDLAE